MFTFTEERLDDLSSKMKTKEQEVEKLKRASIEDLWLQDLDYFEQMYRKQLSEDDIAYHYRVDR